MASKYINPFTDFGFKKLFGEEANKDILLDFLNEVLKDEQGEIESVTFKKNENLGNSVLDRKAIFDLYCENSKGEKFIVEMQKAKHDFFKDRSVFYASFPIREQAEKGTWNYELKAIYTICILDFVFEEDKHDLDKLLYRVKLSDIDTHKVFYDKLTFIYLEMPKFKKNLSECHTHFDKWLYVLRNLERLDRYPENLQEKIFQKIFNEAEIAALTASELTAYDQSLKYYRDLKGCIDTAHNEGVEEGIEKGIEKGRIEGKEEGRIEGIQEGLEKGIEKGIQEGLEKGRIAERAETIKVMSATLSADQIAKILNMPLGDVEETLSKN